MDKNSLVGKILLVVNTGSEKKKFILQKLRKLGLVIVMLHKEQNWAEPYVDHWIFSDTFNHEESLLRVKNFMAENPHLAIEGVLTFWEDDVLLTAKIVEQFNFIGVPYSIAKNVRNKYCFREFCLQNNIPAPRHAVIRTKKDIDFIVKTYNFPLVVKPAFGSSSAYVVKVVNEKELFETVEYIKNNISTDVESALSDGTEILVEEYIDGDEVDIDILLQNGKIKFSSLSDNFNKEREKFFVDSGQAIPSNLPQKDQDDLLSMAEEALEKLGIQNACIHFEAKSTSSGSVPIEINLRMGGDYVYSYNKGAWNVDLIEYAVKIALGIYIKIEMPKNPYKYIVGWDFQVESSGVLVELDINDELKTKKYFEEMQISKEIGDPIFRPPQGYDSLGWITVSGENSLDAQDNLKEALEMIEYRVVKFDEESVLGKTSRENSFSSAIVQQKRRSLLKSKVKVDISLEEQRSLRIGIATNILRSPGKKEVQNSHKLVRNIESELHKRGYKTTLFDFNNILKTCTDLKKNKVDLVLNVSEGIDEDGYLAPQAVALLEALRIPYTGTNSFNFALCKDKIRCKKILNFHNIPTPDWDYAYSIEDSINEDLHYPLIVKSAKEKNTIDIKNNSIVENKKDLHKQIKHILENFRRPALVEEYIEGEEYTVYILGTDEQDLRVLPLVRSLFHKMPQGYWHVSVGKKKNVQKAYEKIVVQSPLQNVSPKLESLITEIAIDAYKIMHCRDYGVVKIRLDEDQNPYVLGINPNPFLEHSLEYFQKSAKLVGMQFGDLLEEIIHLSLVQYRNK